MNPQLKIYLDGIESYADNLESDRDKYKASAADWKAKYEAVVSQPPSPEPEPPPPTPEPPTPPPVTPPPDIVVGDSPRAKTVKVTPATYAQHLGNGPASDTFYDLADGEYRQAAPLTIRANRVTIRGGPKAVLYRAVGKTPIIGIAASSDDVVLEGFSMRSVEDVWKWDYGLQPIGISSSGKGIVCRGLRIDHIHTAFETGAKTDGFSLIDVQNTVDGSISGYFAYHKGKNVTWHRVIARGPAMYALRCNELAGLTIRDSTSTSATYNGKRGRVALQSVSGVNIDGLTIHNSLMIAGPLWDVNGWNQRTSDADFFGRRTKDVTAKGLKITGTKPVLEVGFGCEAWTVEGISRDIVQYPLPKDLPADVASRLAKPKDIFIGGVKVK